MSEAEIIREEPLTGGRSTEGVVRVGDTIRRPISSNGQYVHELLRHLESVDYEAAPRFMGIDEQDREILTYFDGEVQHNVRDIQWTQMQLKQAVGLLRGFHDATAGTPLAGSREVVCHNDFAPWNVVFKDGAPRAIIDFDEAGPGERIKDLSYAMWCWLGLGTPVSTPEEQGIRMRLMCDEYGLSDRSLVLSEIDKRQQEILEKHTLSGNADQVQGVQSDIEWFNLNKTELSETLL